MKVEGTKDVREVDKSSSNAEKTPAKAPSGDRVSVTQVRDAAATIEAAKVNAGVGRATRLRELESAVRNGAYKPDASRVAEQLLQAAEIDARLRAMLKG